MDKIIEVVATYGPFPLGIAVGIWLANQAYSKSMSLLAQQITELREEKKELRKTITSQQGRIDILHDKAYNSTNNSLEGAS